MIPIFCEANAANNWSNASASEYCLRVDLPCYANDEISIDTLDSILFTTQVGAIMNSSISSL